MVYGEHITEDYWNTGKILCPKCKRPMRYHLKNWKDGTYTNYSCPWGCDAYMYVEGD